MMMTHFLKLSRVIRFFLILLLVSACGEQKASVLPIVQNQTTQAVTRPIEEPPVAATSPSFCERWIETHADSLGLSAEVVELLRQGKVQLAIWTARTEGNSAAAIQLQVDVAEILTSGEFTVRDRVFFDDGSIRRFVMDFGNGVQGLYKSHGDLNSPLLHRQMANAYVERIAFLVDRFFDFDLVPVTVLRTVQEGGGLGSVQLWLDGLETDENCDNLDELLGPRAVNFADMVLFDHMIGNIDRNKKNWLVWREANRVVAIDHGISFWRRDLYSLATMQLQNQLQMAISFGETPVSLNVEMAQISSRIQSRLLRLQRREMNAFFTRFFDEFPIARTEITNERIQNAVNQVMEFHYYFEADEQERNRRARRQILE